MQYHHIKNLRDNSITISPDLSTIKSIVPHHNTKPEHRVWCSEATTNHVFYSPIEGDAPRERIGIDNSPRIIHGVVGDYDASVDWSTVEDNLTDLDNPPTWITETWSGYMRIVWEFEASVPTTDELFPAFMREMSKTLGLSRIHAGFDSTSTKASQYFEIGTNWKKIGPSLPKSLTQAAAMKAGATKSASSGDVCIPMDVVAAEVAKQFPNRWKNPFEVGQRGPLFWIADGIDRDGCQIVEDGIVCYSDRAGKGFLTWKEILGSKFVSAFETEKLSGLMNEYWYSGKSFYKMNEGRAVAIDTRQLQLELKRAGFTAKPRKGKPLSEIEQATLDIQNFNRVDEIAPVIFSKERVVHFNSAKILNTASLEPVGPDADGDPAKWPFIYEWLNQLFADTQGKRPTVEYFFAWMKRFYEAVATHQLTQGQALLLVGPTNKGKSLLSNKVIAALVGGFADASEYLSGISQFNKDLARVATWVIDDTTSAASFQDQLKATELIKRAVANPRLQYMAKYADAVSLPWTGRVVMSLNEDANSLSVIPALDSSNRDKIMALRISDKATSSFPANHILEAKIEEEIPHFAKWLNDHVPHADVMNGQARFGVESYIDERIADAAYDNSSRSSIAELVDYFSKQARLVLDGDLWRGTMTEFLIQTNGFNEGRTVGRSNNPEFVRRGMSSMEESYKTNKHVRPIRSEGHGGGKIWIVDVSEKYDIDKMGGKIQSIA